MSSDEVDVHRSPVVFTLDGVEYTSAEWRMPAGQVLREFGRLDPDNYELIRLIGPGRDERFQVDEVIELVEHGRYVSFFVGPMPVE